MVFKNFFVFLTVLSFFHLAAPARADDTASRHEQEEAFARSFAQTVLAIIQDPKKSYSDRKEVLRTAFAKSVDIDWIDKFVLGKTWGSATDEQKEQYTSLYRKFLTETYVSNFAENPDKRIRDIKIFGVNDGEDNFTVRTQMMLADMENLQVNYLVNEQNGHYKVRDIAIENVSLISTRRSEFAAIATSQGMRGSLSALARRAHRIVEPMTLSMNR